MGKKVYICQAIERTRRVEILGQTSSMDLSGMADGCMGVLLAFSNKAKAKKYAGKYGFMTLEVDSNTKG